MRRLGAVRDRRHARRSATSADRPRTGRGSRVDPDAGTVRSPSCSPRCNGPRTSGAPGGRVRGDTSTLHMPVPPSLLPQSIVRWPPPPWPGRPSSQPPPGGRPPSQPPPGGRPPPQPPPASAKIPRQPRSTQMALTLRSKPQLWPRTHARLRLLAHQPRVAPWHGTTPAACCPRCRSRSCHRAARAPPGTPPPWKMPSPRWRNHSIQHACPAPSFSL